MSEEEMEKWGTWQQSKPHCYHREEMYDEEDERCRSCYYSDECHDYKIEIENEGKKE